MLEKMCTLMFIPTALGDWKVCVSSLFPLIIGELSQHRCFQSQDEYDRVLFGSRLWVPSKICLPMCFVLKKVFMFNQMFSGSSKIGDV